LLNETYPAINSVIVNVPAAGAAVHAGDKEKKTVESKPSVQKTTTTIPQ